MAHMIKSFGNDGTPYYYGPFTNLEHALGWAETDLKGFNFETIEMIRPGATYITCHPSDIVDFIGTAHREGNLSYVTVDDVNWAVLPEG